MDDKKLPRRPDGTFVTPIKRTEAQPGTEKAQPKECPEFGKGYKAKDPTCKKCQRAKECRMVMAEVKKIKEDWWAFDRDMAFRLIALNNYNATKLFLIYRNRANNKVEVNKEGMAYGETFVGNETLAREAEISEGYIHRANNILAKAGLVAFVRRKYPGGPWVKRVAMAPDEFVQGLAMNRKTGLSLKDAVVQERMPTPPLPLKV
ncbi:MAG: hypothetical protein WC600_02620 [Desulfobaccales bacterium]